MQPIASNVRGPPPLRLRAGTSAARSLSIVQEGGNNGSRPDRAGMMLSSATSRPDQALKQSRTILHRAARKAALIRHEAFRAPPGRFAPQAAVHSGPCFYDQTTKGKRHAGITPHGLLRDCPPRPARDSDPGRKDWGRSRRIRRSSY
jgi:hypothetical protein